MMKKFIFAIFMLSLTWHCQSRSKGTQKKQEKSVQDAKQIFDGVSASVKHKIKIYFTLGAPELGREEFGLELGFNDSRLTNVFRSLKDKKIKTNKSYLLNFDLDLEASPRDRSFSKISLRFSSSSPFLDSRFKKGIPVNNIAFYVDDKTKYNCYPLQDHEWKINEGSGLVFFDSDSECLEETWYTNMKDKIVKRSSDFLDVVLPKLVATKDGYLDNFRNSLKEQIKKYSDWLDNPDAILRSQKDTIMTLGGSQLVAGGSALAALAGAPIVVASTSVIGMTIGAGIVMYKYKPYLGDGLDTAVFGPYLDGPNTSYTEDVFLQETLSRPYLKCRYYANGVSRDVTPSREVWVSKDILNGDLQNNANFYGSSFYKNYMVLQGRWVLRYDKANLTRAVAFASLENPYFVATACRIALVRAKVVDGILMTKEEESRKIIPIVSYSSHLTEGYPIFFYAKSKQASGLHLLVDEHLNKNVAQKILEPQDWYSVFASHLISLGVEVTAFGFFNKYQFINSANPIIQGVGNAGISNGSQIAAAMGIENTYSLVRYSKLYLANTASSYHGFLKYAGSQVLGKIVANILYPLRVLQGEVPLFLKAEQFKDSNISEGRISCEVSDSVGMSTRVSLPGLKIKNQSTYFFATTVNFFEVLSSCTQLLLGSGDPLDKLEGLSISVASDPLVFYRPIARELPGGKVEKGYQLEASRNWDEEYVELKTLLDQQQRMTKDYKAPLYDATLPVPTIYNSKEGVRGLFVE
ncbi:MAG: hypothetical protein KA436_09375 [Oligoflexales bacterium]|nr:hypothetical protein [Oligoflexales bacterium]